jgi:transposase
VGIVERQGPVRALVAENAKGSTLLPIVKERVLPESTIFTDEWKGYDGISHMKGEYTHRRIKHSQKVYVVGDVHTNTWKDSGA